MADNEAHTAETAGGSAQILEVVEWNSMLENVRANSEAIKDLQQLPSAISEIKGLIQQMMTGADDYQSASDEDHEEEISRASSPDLDATVKSLLSTKNSATKDDESSSSVQNILDQTQTEPEYGPNLRDDVAQSFGRFINKKTSKESIDKWKDLYKAPENCKTLGVPRVNHEIWAVLPNKARQCDVHWQGLQTHVSMTSVALSRMAEKVVAGGAELPGKWQEQLLQMILECASINNLANQALIAQRKKDMRPSVSSEASVICGANNVTTELLFGNDFQNEIKTSKSALNAVKIKQGKFQNNFFGGKKDNRFTPYKKPSGNFSAPPLQARSAGRIQTSPKRQSPVLISTELQEPSVILQLQPEPIVRHTLYAGRLCKFINNWKMLTSEHEILDIVLGYHIPFVVRPYQRMPPTETNFPPGDVCKIEDIISNLISIGAIEEVIPVNDQFISTIFAVPKKDGSFRLILNLKSLNKFLHAPHFKLEDYRNVLSLISKNSYMATLDLKDAYHLIPIHENDRKYLRFQFRGRLFQYACLPFGLATAPRVFTKLLRPIAHYLRLLGFCSNFYLDDIMLIESSIQACNANVEETIGLFTWLGFLINYEKSSLLPSTTCLYLGFNYDSTNLKLSLPQTKREKILKLINQTFRKKEHVIQDIAVLIGNLVAASPAIDYGSMYTRILEKDKTTALFRNHHNYNSVMQLSAESYMELLWWKSHVLIANSLIRRCIFDYEITTDASLTGWGAHLDHLSTRGFWNSSEKMLHINTLEIIAIYNGILSLLRQVSTCQILIRCDNTTAISYINRYGGCRSEVNHAWAKALWKWCEVRHIWLFASYIKSSDNVLADAKSREDVDKYDYGLDYGSFITIKQKLGTPVIDMFASCHTRKCSRFISWFPDPECENVDAFTVKWHHEFYAFPPFSLVGRVINKIIDEKVEGILVAPYWPSQAWFPLFVKLAVSNLVYFPPDTYTLISPHTNKLHAL